MPTVAHMAGTIAAIGSAVSVGTAVVAANSLVPFSAAVVVTATTYLMDLSDALIVPNHLWSSAIYGELPLGDGERVVKYQKDWSKKAFVTRSCLTTTIRSI